MRQAPLASPRVPDESAPRARAACFRFLALFGVAASLSLSLAGPVAAQDEDADTTSDDDTDTAEPTTTRVNTPASGSAPMPADFSGSLQIVRGPATVNGGATPGTAPEIFPEASRVFMSVRDTDPVPIETARRGGPWLCSTGQCSTTLGEAGQSRIGDDMLRSIKLQTPTLPLPLTIWGRLDEQGKRTLDFDPVLLGRRDYRHVCAYPPIGPNDKAGPRKVEKAPLCRDDMPVPPLPDSAEVLLGMQWPKQSEMADFRYIAIVDSCGNARVQPFQRTFTVPVFEVASGGCGKADGKVLRIFPSGGWLRVTAFNLDNTAAGTVVNATYRVSVPPLENLVESNPARMLFPDPQLEDLKVDCGPAMRRSSGLPSAPPSSPSAPPPGVRPLQAAAAPPPDAAPKTAPREPEASGLTPRTAPKPGDKPQVQATSKNPAPKTSPVAPRTSPMGPPRPSLPMKATAPAGPGPQPLAHMSLVIAPEPLRQGVCRVRLSGSTKGRLVAPLALYVSLTRTDRTSNGAPIELLTDHKWIVTPNSAEFQLPPLSENFDGDSRLRLAVYSDPLNTDGKVVLVSDASRVAASLRSGGEATPEAARRLIGSATIHSVPLCGESNFETLEAAGSCLRAYLTIPAMLATLQITRAPWLERPLVTRSVLSAVGVALAVDSYDPVRRRAFPVAGQLGGSIQQLGDGRVGLLGYLGVAPTIPVLGDGGNTTSFGFLAGIGLSYITNESGPDEGLKPAAFLSVVVQVGQATPQVSSSGRAVFGTYQGE
ncbi:hypothetical protein [Polyangium jinanense]|uniref:Uncharacterized protein n=1 Tax=Polyangium jinanense TaxID=2829994 RepID=A0A9X3XDC4_9BACT|nr:hypothetical protein [Polyangium jinanense]MDC3960761.1 hypothetical protein [Polyangium jinanense]MDC3985861.1 hypothetical protein [Polyangium jinanense]